MRRRFALALVLVALCGGAEADDRRVQIKGRQLIVDGEEFLVKGICYSPVPINESVYFAPYGDYFTAEYSFIWLRDLPLMKAMGANVVRIYGWLPKNDHSAFLDALHAHGLYLMATFYMGEATEAPVGTHDQRTKVLHDFTQQVTQYKDHPALLMWSFGNELNGVWNGFLQELSAATDYGEVPGGIGIAGQKGDDCGWDERYDDLGGCWIHTGKLPQPGDVCYETSYCVYARLFGLINEAAKQAKGIADVLVVSAFADVDALYDKVDRAGDLAPDVGAWTAQVYRGISFGDFFAAMGNSTEKPVLLTEYGVDAYHDECGADATTTPCYNVLGDRSKSYEDEDAQAYFALNLTYEIHAHSSEHKHCATAGRGDEYCSAIGGFLMSWADEYWKGAKSQASCTPTIREEGFSTKKCTLKAHVTCGNWDAATHDLCGYWLESAPDHYVNEEWFGITSPTRCENSIDSLRARATYWKMRALWNDGAPKDDGLFDDCKAIVSDRCVDLGDGGRKSLAQYLGLGAGFGAGLLGEADQSPSHAKGGKPLPCSGRGSCTSVWEECGLGGAADIATPCCSCDTGFAGLGCEQLDARTWLVLGLLGGVALLLLLMLACFASSRLCGWPRRKLPPLEEPLLVARQYG